MRVRPLETMCTCQMIDHRAITFSALAGNGSRVIGGWVGLALCMDDLASQVVRWIFLPRCRPPRRRRCRTAAAGDMSGEALWRVVDEVAENVGTLSEADAEALRGPAEKIQRLRDLHSSCMPHERQLRATHLALLTDHYLCSDKLLQLRRYCSVHLQDPALPEADRQLLLSLQQLTASLDKPNADAPQSA